MKQQFKTIYFSDFPSESAQGKNLTLAFGKKDAEIYEALQALSSQEIRERLQCPTYTALQEAASAEDLPINTYCLRLLRRQNQVLRDAPPQQYFANALEETPYRFDPLQATFRGGQSEPMHTWYPYLEGYSPQFVEQLCQQFVPEAVCVLDPFSGAGTTPLTIARLGKNAFYCELNPLMQFLTELKSDAQTLENDPRRRLIDFLDSQAATLESSLRNACPDSELKQAYANVFGASRFFDEDTLDLILRARTLIDYQACAYPAESRFLALAFVASLIPVSHLIRRGDLRFKTGKELEQPKPDFVSSVQDHLALMGKDLERLIPIENRPTLVCENARELLKLPGLQADAVITSPPYLNGTNYFRNTKIELWFLRCLQSGRDLAALRYQAITAGINDVTVRKEKRTGSARLCKLMEQLEVSAYDSRIPRMVANYFSDMQAIFQGIKSHLKDNAALLMDIGDSAYGGIHVPTHTLLAEMLEAEGFTLKQEITLRKRMSRSGFPLHQTLLNFQFAPPASSVREMKSRIKPCWEKPWTKFKTELPHQQGLFAKRNWGHPLHSLCSYQGKMKPSLAAHLVGIFVPEGGAMLDPFAGVGTLSFAATLTGIRSWAFDINPAALCIAKAKTGRHEAALCERVLRELENFLMVNQSAALEQEIGTAQNIRFNGLLADYFHPDTFREVLLARRYFLANPPQDASEALVMACLLHILHGNRPYALSRRSHPITPFAPSGPFEYRALIPRLRTKVARSLQCVESDELEKIDLQKGKSDCAENLFPVLQEKPFVPGVVYNQDATTWWPQEVNQLDAVITSPPFFDSTRFYLANWMRLWFCGWEASDFRTQPLAFVDERQKGDFAIYEPIFRQARERLKSDGVMVLHLGMSKKCDMAAALAQVASRWFRVADVFTESVSHCESHGIRDKGTVTSHQYLILQ